MSNLFVDKTIEINAPPFRVWEVLTKREYTAQWAPEFSGNTPFTIESEWQIGSPVFWKDQNGKVVVEGNITALEPNKFLRFTVFDVRAERPPVKDGDGITYKLTNQNAKTRLWVSQGDFSAMPDGEKYRDLSAAVWDRVLPKVKHLAEQ